MTRLRLVLLGLLTTLFTMGVGCNKADEGPKATAQEAAASSTPARSAATLLKKIAERLPATSSLIAVVDLKYTINGLRNEGLTFLPAVKDPGAFRADMSSVYLRFLGIDPLKADYAIVFGDPRAEKVSVFVAGDFDDLKIPGAETTTIGGKPATLIGGTGAVLLVEGGVIAGRPEFLETFFNKDPRLADTPLMAAHLAALGRLGPVPYALSIATEGLLSEIPDDSPLAGLKASHAAAGLDPAAGSIVTTITAEKSERDRISALISLGLSVSRAFVEGHAKKVETAGDIQMAMLAVAARHLGPPVLDLPKTTDDGEALTMRVTLPGVGNYVPMIGILAAIAIPAFQKYMDRARSSSRCTEAVEHLMSVLTKEDFGGDADLAEKMRKSLMGQRPEFMKKCLAATPDAVDCLLKANSMDELGRCDL